MMFRIKLLAYVSIFVMVLSACGGGAAPTAAPTATTASAATATKPPAGTATPAASPTLPPVATGALVTQGANFGGIFCCDTDGAPVKGGTYTFAAAESMNPSDPHVTASAHPNVEMLALFDNNIVRMNLRTRAVVPELAESYEWKGPLELTFHLRKGIHYHKTSLAKGREMVANDVVTTFNRMLSPNPPVGSLLQAFPNVIGYTEVDPYTVVVKFKTPDVGYLEWLTTANFGVVIPKEFADKYPVDAKGVWTSWSQTELWDGTGPFLFDVPSFSADVSLKGLKNPTYEVFPGMPYVDAIVGINIVDNSARSAAIKTGQVNSGIPANAERDAYIKAGFEINSNESQVIANQAVTMNVQVYPTNDPRFRQAINMALDREALKQVVADGWGCVGMVLGCVPGYFLPESDWAGKPGWRKDKAQDYAEAKQLLKDMNYDFSTKLTYVSAGQGNMREHFEQAVAIVQMLRQNLGLNIDHHYPAESDNRSQAYWKKTGYHFLNYTAGGPGSHITDWVVSTTLMSTSFQNVSLWYDKKMDDLGAAEKAETDPVKRKLIFQEIQKWVMDPNNLPQAPNVRGYNFIAAGKNVRGYHPDGFYITATNAWEFQHAWLVK